MANFREFGNIPVLNHNRMLSFGPFASFKLKVFNKYATSIVLVLPFVKNDLKALLVFLGHFNFSEQFSSYLFKKAVKVISAMQPSDINLSLLCRVSRDPFLDVLLLTRVFIPCQSFFESFLLVSK